MGSPINVSDERIPEEFFESIRNLNNNFTFATEGETFSVFSSAIFYVLIAGVSGFLILSATILCFTYWFYVKRKTSPVEGSLSDLSFHVHGDESNGIEHEKQEPSSASPNVNNIAEETSLIDPPSWSMIDVNKLKVLYGDVTVSDQNVEKCKALQEGTFASIYLGLFHKPFNYGNQNGKSAVNGSSGPPRKAFIKTVVRQATQIQIATMLQDALLLKGVVHKHLMSPVAIAFSQPCGYPQIVYASASFGNLKKVLTVSKWPSNHGRGSFNEPSRQGLVFSVRNLIEIATQVLKAVRHLHRVSVVHKDIAARNCFLTSGTDGMRVRLCDPCLSRDLFPDEYHCLLDNENRPIRWLALEAIEEKLYSRATDVWAFGVFLWELFTLGQIPYADVDPFEMATVLADGLRVQKPPNCPDPVYSLMICCWLLNPEQRPATDKINDFFQAYISHSPL